MNLLMIGMEYDVTTSFELPDAFLRRGFELQLRLCVGHVGGELSYLLAAKLEEGAARAEQEQASRDQETAEEKLRKEADRASRGRTAGGSTRRSTRKEKSVVEEVITSTTFRQVARTAAREIVRGMFGTGRRR